MEIARLGYYTEQEASISDNSFEIPVNIKINTRVAEALFRYGHPVGEAGLELSYELTILNFNQRVNFSDTVTDSTFLSIPQNVYTTPAFSQISLTTGLSKLFAKGWNGSTTFSINLTDDLFGTAIQNNLTWGSTTYFEKTHSKHFSYGLGIFTNQLEGRFLLAPILNLNLHNEKWGLNLLLPQKATLWHRVSPKSYADFYTSLHSFSLKFQPINPVNTTDIIMIRSGINYSYIWEDFLKLSIGIYLPVNYHIVDTQKTTFNYVTGNTLGLNLSVSMIIQE